jgi:hypothetical protein
MIGRYIITRNEENCVLVSGNSVISTSDPTLPEGSLRPMAKMSIAGTMIFVMPPGAPTWANIRNWM